MDPLIVSLTSISQLFLRLDPHALSSVNKIMMDLVIITTYGLYCVIAMMWFFEEISIGNINDFYSIRHFSFNFYMYRNRKNTTSWVEWLQNTLNGILV